MRSGVLLALAALAGVLGVSSASEEVVSINGYDHFNEAIASADVVLAKFYAPWCGHCKRMAPELDKAAASLQNGLNSRSIAIIKIDCDIRDNSKLKKVFQINGYPTLKLFSDGKYVRDYKGPREAAGIADHLLRFSQPPMVRLEGDSVDTFTLFGDGVVANFILVANDDDPAVAKMDELAKEVHEHVWFAHALTVPGKLTANIGGTLEPPYLLAVHRGSAIPSQPVTVDAYKGKYDDIEDVKSWISVHRLPIISAADSKTFPLLTRGHERPAFLLVTDKNKKISKDAFVSRLEGVAEKWRETYFTATLDINDYDKFLADEFKIVKGEAIIPTVLVFNYAKQTHFYFEGWREVGDNEAASANAFLDAIEKGEVPETASPGGGGGKGLFKKVWDMAEGLVTGASQGELGPIVIFASMAISMIVVFGLAIGPSGPGGAAAAETKKSK